MPKSPDAFRTISEVAEWLDTPAHVLRFWESKFTQVKPVKRAGGRRYYRPADMLLLGGIKKLLHDDGLTIKGAQKLLREHGVKHVAALSQSLDEDLVEEAGFIENAEPEPVAEEPATVLSFPNRQSEDPASDNVAAEVPAKDEAVEEDIAPASDDPARAPDVAASETKDDDAEEHTEAGKDAFEASDIPAFLRRSPAPPPAEKPDSAATESASSSPRLTIDPVATLQPSEDAEQSEQTAQPASSDEETAADLITADNSASDAETAAVTPDPAPATPLMENIPTVAKIAPPFDAFEGPAGLLGSMDQMRRISPALANELTSHLDDLRALRERMRG